jgi:hypothetical protein
MDTYKKLENCEELSDQRRIFRVRALSMIALIY